MKHNLFLLAPCFNEEKNILNFLKKIISLDLVKNIVLIDDGSEDNTVKKILDFKAKINKRKESPEIVLIELTRNFGKESALLAGLDYVNKLCEGVIIIDADLQHPPELIPKMIELWKNGAEIVTAIRCKKDSESFFRIASASWFYKVFNKVVNNIQIKEGAGDFRLLSSDVINSLIKMREYRRFSKGLIPWTGYKTDEIYYERKLRNSGKSSWGFTNLFGYAIDGIFSFSILPLRIWIVFGILCSLISLLYTLYIILTTITNGVDVPGYASLIVAILFLGGVQLIGIGVLGEYLGRVFIDIKSRPHYFIRKIHKVPQSDLSK